MNKQLSLAAIASLGLLTWQAQAQKTGWSESGKLEDTEIIVEKDRKIELPVAARNFQKAKIQPPAKKLSTVEYTFNDLKLPNVPVATNMRVLTIKQEDLPSLYGNFVRAGFGNYITPYLQAYFHNKRSDQYSVGASVRHLSSKNGPVQKDKSGVSNTGLELTGEAYKEKHTVGGRIGYDRDRFNFYGYTPDFLRSEAATDDTIKQLFNRFSSRVFAHNHNGKEKLQYEFGVGYNFLNDNFNAKETDFLVDLATGYALSPSAAVKLETNASFLKVSQNGDVTRNFVRLSPYYDANFGKLSVQAGANMALTGDTLHDAKSFNIYPRLQLGYQVIENQLTVFGGVVGDMERQSLFKLTRENPWLAPTNFVRNDSLSTGVETSVHSLVQNTNKPLDAYIGVKGKAGPSLAYQVRGGYQLYKNLYFFSNSPEDSARFTLLYDTATTKAINVAAEVTYSATAKLRVGLKANYTNWNVEKVKSVTDTSVYSLQPLYRPPFIGDLFATYSISDKIFVTLDLYYIGASFARNFQAEQQKGTGPKDLKTDNVIDLGLKGDYNISDRLSAFVSLHNLLGKQYQRYLYYPQRGVQVLAGASYAF